MKELFDFQIGDRVVVVDYDVDNRKSILLGHEGTVVGFEHKFVQVAHDEPLMTDMGSFHGKCKPGHGWVYYPRELGLVSASVPACVDDLL